MGAGKTILIGAIVATEFAMAIEYADADPAFVDGQHERVHRGRGRRVQSTERSDEPASGRPPGEQGDQGWNCPSLFATALARRLRTSNNFVLQAATRCLRQFPGRAERKREAAAIGVSDRCVWSGA
jgi:type III restriction enzyme